MCHPKEKLVIRGDNDNSTIATATPTKATQLLTKAYLQQTQISKLSESTTKRNNVDKRQETHFVVQHDYHDHAEEKPDQYCGTQPRRGGVTTPFPIKLHEMLDRVDDDGFAHIVSWQPHGRCFVVHKPKEFKELLPKYFKQTKMGSFLRQLNLYGFSRLTRGRDKGGYYHELFLRGKHFLANKINRIKVKGTGVRARSNPSEEPNLWDMTWVECRNVSSPSPSSIQSSGAPINSRLSASTVSLSSSTSSLEAMNTNNSMDNTVEESPSQDDSGDSSMDEYLDQLIESTVKLVSGTVDDENLDRVKSSNQQTDFVPSEIVASEIVPPEIVPPEIVPPEIVPSKIVQPFIEPRSEIEIRPEIVNQQPVQQGMVQHPTFVQSSVVESAPIHVDELIEKALIADGLLSPCRVEEEEDDIVWSFGGKCFHYMDPLHMFDSEQRPTQLNHMEDFL